PCGQNGSPGGTDRLRNIDTSCIKPYHGSVETTWHACACVAEGGTGSMQDKGPLYIISVASRLLAMHPQTLRKYERAGFVAPSRTKGNLRLYSPEDIQRLRQIKYLVDDVGVTTLAGVQMALDVSGALRRLLYRAE